MSLPILAVAYTLGGLSPQDLACGAWWLLLAAVQGAVLGLACSACFRTTSAAFVASYLLGAILLFGPAMICALLQGNRPLPRELWFPFFAPALCSSQRNVLAGPASLHPLVVTVQESLPILVSTGGIFLAARYFLVRGVLASPRHILLDWMETLDHWLSRRSLHSELQDLAVLESPSALPADDPIAWRETRKRSLGSDRHLVRLLAIFEVPLVVLLSWLVYDSPASQPAIVTYLTFGHWGISVLLVCVQAASLIGAEKSAQSLDVLCTTPLATREIIRQKMQSVDRMIAVLLLPFLTLVTFQVWWRARQEQEPWSPRRGSPDDTIWYVIGSLVTYCVYLCLVAWMSLWMGMTLKSRSRAIVASLAVVVGWAVFPYLFCILPLVQVQGGLSDPSVLLLNLSPLTQILIIEWSYPPGHYSIVVTLVVNTMIYGALWPIFRWQSLSAAAGLLGRCESAEELRSSRRPPYPPRE